MKVLFVRADADLIERLDVACAHTLGNLSRAALVRFLLDEALTRRGVARMPSKPDPRQLPLPECEGKSK
jgi:hypothetical protein